MNKDLKSFLKNYGYILPKHLIVEHPAKPKDDAKLLIYRKNQNKAK